MHVGNGTSTDKIRRLTDQKINKIVETIKEEEKKGAVGDGIVRRHW